MKVAVEGGKIDIAQEAAGLINDKNIIEKETQGLPLTENMYPSELTPRSH